jgi:prepilin-type N-terminal cleavage/methylation domain-containing protein
LTDDISITVKRLCLFMHSFVTKKLSAHDDGFTLIELLVVIGILAILLAITLLALNPTQHFQGARNAQRSSDVTAILDGIYEYEAAHTGSLPPSVAAVTAAPEPISTTVIDPCTELVPTYLADLPLDPATGTRTGSTTCAGGASTYSTGYTIAKSVVSNRFTVAAPAAEGGANISVTR